MPKQQGPEIEGTASRAVTQVLAAVKAGDPRASVELLPLVYSELRKLAQSRMAKTPAGNTLQPTALVHEAFLRLVGSDDPSWNSRGHFFAAAANAMRQILVEQSRRKASVKHGGDFRRIEDGEFEVETQTPPEDLLALDEALKQLEKTDARKAQIVTLKFFGGLTSEETAAALEISIPTVEREWRFARTLLYTQIMGRSEKPASR